VDDAALERWLAELLVTPGLTAVGDARDARRMLVDDVLRAVPLLAGTSGSIVDVGSGGGSPGVPLALALPERRFRLVESRRRRCDFLERVTNDVSNVEVVWGRAEEQPTDEHGAALAKALAKPPVAAELCLPLVQPDGIAILWVGETADAGAVSTAAERVGGRLESESDGLLVLRKVEPTPAGFPRRPGMARKRPLA